MTLAAKLTEDMKSALKAGDKIRLATLRMALAAVKQQEIDTRQPLEDTDVVRVLEKLIKRGRDAETQFRAGDRGEQADKEAREIAILGEYLPEQLSDAELGRLIDTAIAESGATTMRDMGKVMGILKAKAAGRIDMAAANQRVRALLQQV